MEIRRKQAVHYVRLRIRTSCLFNQSEQIRLATAAYFSRAWHRFYVFPRARRHRLHTFPRLMAPYDWFFVLLAHVVIRRLPRCGWKVKTTSKSYTLNVKFMLFSTPSTEAVTNDLYLLPVHCFLQQKDKYPSCDVYLLIAVQQHFSHSNCFLSLPIVYIFVYF